MDRPDAGKVYKPWPSSTPVVLVTSKKHIAEFSEITCLSQQVVYTDVGHPCTTLCGGRHHFTLLMPYYQMFGFKHTMKTWNMIVSTTKLYETDSMVDS